MFFCFVLVWYFDMFVGYWCLLCRLFLFVFLLLLFVFAIIYLFFFLWWFDFDFVFVLILFCFVLINNEMIFCLLKWILVDRMVVLWFNKYYFGMILIEIVNIMCAFFYVLFFYSVFVFCYLVLLFIFDFDFEFAFFCFVLFIKGFE